MGGWGDWWGFGLKNGWEMGDGLSKMVGDWPNKQVGCQILAPQTGGCRGLSPCQPSNIQEQEVVAWNVLDSCVADVQP